MNENTYDALTVARYVINKSNAEGMPISNLKLQKILYYIQAVFLSINGDVCFKDDIEAWAFGPVVPNTYHEFKGYGSNNIPKITTYLDMNPSSNTFFEKVMYTDETIYDEDRELIDDTLELYGKYSATELVEKTHNEDPWKNNYKRYNRNVVIPISDMQKYFKDYFTRG